MIKGIKKVFAYLLCFSMTLGMMCNIQATEIVTNGNVTDGNVTGTPPELEDQHNILVSDGKNPITKDEMLHAISIMGEDYGMKRLILILNDTNTKVIDKSVFQALKDKGGDYSLYINRRINGVLQYQTIISNITDTTVNYNPYIFENVQDERVDSVIPSNIEYDLIKFQQQGKAPGRVYTQFYKTDAFVNAPDEKILYTVDYETGDITPINDPKVNAGPGYIELLLEDGQCVNYLITSEKLTDLKLGGIQNTIESKPGKELTASEIISKINTVPAGSNSIHVMLQGDTTKMIDKTVFAAAKAKGITLKLSKYDDTGALRYKMNFLNIDDSNIDFNTEVIVDAKNEDIQGLIPEGVASSLFEFNHSGKLPGKLEIEFFMKNSLTSSSNPKYMYYVNEDTGVLDYMENAVVNTSNNSVTIQIDHCSSYLVVDQKLDNTKFNASNTTSPNTGDTNNSALLWSVLLLSAFVMIGLKYNNKKQTS